MHAILASALLATSPIDAPAAPDPHVDVMGQIGGMGGDGFGGVAVGGTVLAHASVLGGGAMFEASGLFSSRFGVGIVGGLSHREEEGGLGIDLLGTLGVHHYEGVGKGLLSSDPGVGGSLMFAGGRARVSYRIRRRFQLGATAMMDFDLDRVTKTATYQSTGWFSGNTTTETSSHRIGFNTAGLVVDIGATF